MCLELLFSLLPSICLSSTCLNLGMVYALFKTLFQSGCQSCLPLITSQSSFLCFFLKKVETVFLLLCLQRSGSSPWVSNSCKTIFKCPSAISVVCHCLHRATQASNKAAESASPDFATEPPTMAWWPLMWWKGAKTPHPNRPSAYGLFLSWLF